MAGKAGKKLDFLMIKINQFWLNPVLNFIFRVIIGVLFIYASLDKINDPESFAGIVRNYRVLPEVLTNLAALIIPWLELICGLGLITGVCFKGSAAILGGLLVLFIIGLVAATVRGFDIDCGCYKISGLAAKAGFRRTLEDIILLLMLSQSFFVKRSYFNLAAWFSKLQNVKNLQPDTE
jgi:uncharacterized membrane protein YphA (DoxX/SURF4 family)